MAVLEGMDDIDLVDGIPDDAIDIGDMEDCDGCGKSHYYDLGQLADDAVSVVDKAMEAKKNIQTLSTETVEVKVVWMLGAFGAGLAAGFLLGKLAR